MKLGVLDRLVVLNLLPVEGDFTTLRVIRDLKAELSFTEEEHKAIKFNHDDKGALLGFVNDVQKDVIVGPVAHSLIVGKLVELEGKGKLPLDFLSVFEKFVGDIPEKPKSKVKPKAKAKGKYDA